MKLAGNEPRVIGQLDNLYQISLRVNPADLQAELLQRSAEGVVKFVPVAMALLNFNLGVSFLRN